jgi:sensor histidine kinase YesM
MVSLDQELDALTLYVSLEKLRFDHELEFKLSHDDDVDTASIKVPPLILQPFVENALHHGLLPKQGIGILNVRIEELDQTLHIEVEDNGIGREQAHQVKKSDLQHESMGMKLTNERIALMNNDHTKSTVSVQDLHDSNGQPTGTKVIINIPKII